MFVFDCDPAKILEALDPDFLFKGGPEYDSPDKVPEIARSGWDGEFVHLGVYDGGESTTQIIQRIRASQNPVP